MTALTIPRLGKPLPRVPAPSSPLGSNQTSQESISDLVPPPDTRPYKLAAFSAQYLVDELEGPILQDLRNLSLLFSQALRGEPPQWAKSDARRNKLQSTTRGALTQWEAKLENTIVKLSDLAESAQSEASHPLRLTSHKPERNLISPPLEQPLNLPALSELSPPQYRSLWRYALGLTELVDQMIERVEYLRRNFTSETPLNHGQLDRLSGGYANFRQQLHEILEAPQVGAPMPIENAAQTSASQKGPAPVAQKAKLKSQRPVARINSRASTSPPDSKIRQASKTSKPFAQAPFAPEPLAPAPSKSPPVHPNPLAAATEPEQPIPEESRETPIEQPLPSPSSASPRSPAADEKATSLLSWSAPTTPQAPEAAESRSSKNLPPFTPASHESLITACNKLRVLRQTSLLPTEASAPTEAFPEHLRQQVGDMATRLAAAKNLPQAMINPCTVIATSLEMLLSIFSSGQASVGVSQELTEILGMIESA